MSEGWRRDESAPLVLCLCGHFSSVHEITKARAQGVCRTAGCGCLAVRTDRAFQREHRWVDLATDEAAADLDSLIARLKGEGDVA